MKLATKVLLILVFIMSTVMGIYAVYEMKRSRTALTKEAAGLHDLLLSGSLSSFSYLLWNMDTETTTTTLTAMFEHGHPVNISVYSADGSFYAGMEQPDPSDKKKLNSLTEGESLDKVAEDIEISKPLGEFSKKSSDLIKVMKSPKGKEDTLRIASDIWYISEGDPEPKHIGYILLDYSTAYIKQEIAGIRTRITIFAVVMSLVILSLIFAFLRVSVIQPIRTLAGASLEVAKGNYQTVKPLKSRDEISMLTGNFNSMVIDINRNTENLNHLVAEGRTISAMFALSTIEAQVKKSFSTIFSGNLKVEVYFSKACSLTSDLEDGFYRIAGEDMVPDTRLATSDFTEAKFYQQIAVKDSKTDDTLAFIVLDSDDRPTLNKYLSTFQTLANNVASAITAVLLEQTMRIVEKKTGELRTIFANITQGIGMIDNDLQIQPEHSDFLKAILRDDDLTKKQLLGLLFADSDIGTDVRQQVIACLNGSLGEDMINFELNNGLLPRELKKKAADGSTQYLELDWLPLIRDDIVERFMITIRDTTAIQKLKEAAEANKKEMEYIEQIVNIKPDNFLAYISGSRGMLHSCMTLFSSNKKPSKDELVIAKRDLHTIKGNSRSYGVTHVASAIHEIESKLIEFLENGETLEPGSASREQLIVDLKAADAVINRYEEINDKKLMRTSSGISPEMINSISAAQNLARSLVMHKNNPAKISGSAIEQLFNTLVFMDARSVNEVLGPIEKSLLQLAEDLGKKPVKLIVEGDGYLTRDAADTLYGAFTHIIRNSVDHGFDKEMDGRITISSSKSANRDDRTVLCYQDNGRGLNLNKIREKATALGITAPSGNQAIAELIFASGFSTASVVTDVSGRGVGMDAAKAAFEAVGGNLHIELIGQPDNLGFNKFRIIVDMPSTVLMMKDSDSVRGHASQSSIRVA